jgi:PAP2 superfamily
MAAAAYGLVMAVAAVTQPIARRPVAVAAALAYALVAAGLATLSGSLWIDLVVPGALLLTGYWLSGLMFRTPQPWLEEWLLRTDRALGAHRWMRHLPRPVVEFLEACYAADYIVVGGGAIIAAVIGGTQAVAYYCSLVLTSELAAFAPLPWLRSRPPRAIVPVGASHGTPIPDGTPSRVAIGPAMAGPYFRRLNAAILNHGSIQANTLPSGHVSGAVAAALGVMPLDAGLGWALMVVAGLIAIAAIAGRYHYLVDCVAGAAVSLAVWSLL